MNPFTDETRDARLKMEVEGFCDTLRAPESLKRLFMDCKPAGHSVGDFALLEMFNGIIDAHKVAYDYRAIQRLLDTFFGPLSADWPVGPPVGVASVKGVPNGTGRAERHGTTR